MKSENQRRANPFQKLTEGRRERERETDRESPRERGSRVAKREREDRELERRRWSVGDLAPETEMSRERVFDIFTPNVKCENPNFF